MLKILSLNMTKAELNDKSFDEVKDLLAEAGMIDSDEDSGDIHLISMIDGPSKEECHGFVIGKNLVCVDSIEDLVHLVLALQELLEQVGTKDVDLGLRIIKAMMVIRESKRSDKKVDAKRASRVLKSIFDLASKPEKPDA